MTAAQSRLVFEVCSRLHPSDRNTYADLLAAAFNSAEEEISRLRHELSRAQQRVSETSWGQSTDRWGY